VNVTVAVAVGDGVRVAAVAGEDGFSNAADLAGFALRKARLISKTWDSCAIF
jgi:hypothetical protein